MQMSDSRECVICGKENEAGMLVRTFNGLRSSRILGKPSHWEIIGDPEPVIGDKRTYCSVWCVNHEINFEVPESARMDWTSI